MTFFTSWLGKQKNNDVIDTDEWQYLNLLQDILDNGIDRNDRTGVGTREVFGRQLRFDLSKGFPLLTTKKMFLKGIIVELLWFLRGDTNIKYLHDNNVHIWDEWADQNGDLNRIYGKQWRSWRTWDRVGQANSYKEIDQIAIAVDKIKNNPDDRGIIISAWNVGELNQMALRPCHAMFQFNVINNKLICLLLQRSCDVGAGIPFNIGSYALLTMMMAQVCGLQPGEFIHTLGSAHIYKNHLEGAQEQIKRKPYAQPKMIIKPDIKNIDDFKLEDFKIIDYQYHSAIKFPIAV